MNLTDRKVLAEKLENLAGVAQTLAVLAREGGDLDGLGNLRHLVQAIKDLVGGIERCHVCSATPSNGPDVKLQPYWPPKHSKTVVCSRCADSLLIKGKADYCTDCEVLFALPMERCGEGEGDFVCEECHGERKAEETCLCPPEEPDPDDWRQDQPRKGEAREWKQKNHESR